MANLIANTSKSEIDTRLQQLAAAIMTMREKVTVLDDWKAPLDAAYLESLGYDSQQVDEMTWFVDLASAWTEQIGTGGTMTPADGQLFERMLVQIHGLGGMLGVVTAPAP